MTRYTVDPPAFLELARLGIQPPGHQLVGAAALRSQALSLLYRSTPSRRMEEVRPVIDAITTLRVRLLGDRVSRATAWRIAEDLGLDDTAEAEYLAVTRLQADALVALDPGIRAIAAGVVPLADLDELLPVP